MEMQRGHLHCSASGTPTILEAGATSFALDLALVQPDVAPSSARLFVRSGGLGLAAPTGDADLIVSSTTAQQPWQTTRQVAGRLKRR